MLVDIENYSAMFLGACQLRGEYFIFSPALPTVFPINICVFTAMSEPVGTDVGTWC